MAGISFQYNILPTTSRLSIDNTIDKYFYHNNFFQHSNPDQMLAKSGTKLFQSVSIRYIPTLRGVISRDWEPSNHLGTDKIGDDRISMA